MIAADVPGHHPTPTGARARLGGAHPGRGYDTGTTRFVVDHAPAVCPHRLSPDVLGVDPRAQRVHERCGSVRDGGWRDELVVPVPASAPR